MAAPQWPALGIAFCVLAARVVLGLVFLAAAIAKLSDVRAFTEAVAGYELVPRRLVAPLAGLLPYVEAALGLLVILGVALAGAASALAFLLSAFAGAVAVNLRRGRVIDCGCGPSKGKKIGWRLLAQDLALVVLAALVAITALPSLALVRGPTALWVLPSPAVPDAAVVCCVAPFLVIGRFLIPLAIQTAGVIRELK